MKTIGRILLLVVGVALIAFAIPKIINDVNVINEIGWQNVFSNEVAKSSFISLIIQGVNCIFGITAFFACLSGKASFWLTIFSLIMIVGVVIYIINAVQAGTISEWTNTLETILGFALPIGYFLGSILIRFNKN